MSNSEGKLDKQEQEIARLQQKLLDIERQRAEEPDLEFKPDVEAAIERALTSTRAELTMAESQRATCLSDLRAEEDRRRADKAESETAATNRRSRVYLLIAVGSLLVTVAKTIYDLLR